MNGIAHESIQEQIQMFKTSTLNSNGLANNIKNSYSVYKELDHYEGV